MLVNSTLISHFFLFTMSLNHVISTSYCMLKLMLEIESLFSFLFSAVIKNRILRRTNFSYQESLKRHKALNPGNKSTQPSTDSDSKYKARPQWKNIRSKNLLTFNPNFNIWQPDEMQEKTPACNFWTIFEKHRISHSVVRTPKRNFAQR